ncbi:uncharacterized protein [Periplaneta americana]|uniref:uncharacterized protein isoform X3 n=1 Tax=Periplaneta americana TaxID=6978 RepID=UPI0037E92834
MDCRQSVCESCGTSCNHNEDRRSHVGDKHDGNNEYQCSICRRIIITIVLNLRRQTRELRSSGNFPCEVCNSSFEIDRYLKDHKSSAHGTLADPPPMSPSQHDIVSEPAASPMPGPSRMTVSPIAGPSHKIVEPTATTSNNEDQRLPENSTSTKHDEEFDEDIW